MKKPSLTSPSRFIFWLVVWRQSSCIFMTIILTLQSAWGGWWLLPFLVNNRPNNLLFSSPAGDWNFIELLTRLHSLFLLSSVNSSNHLLMLWSKVTLDPSCRPVWCRSYSFFTLFNHRLFSGLIMSPEIPMPIHSPFIIFLNKLVVLGPSRDSLSRSDCSCLSVKSNCPLELHCAPY